MNSQIRELAKANLFYFNNGLRYLIRSSTEDGINIVRKGENGQVDHVFVSNAEVDEKHFAVLKSSFGVLTTNGRNFQKYKKDDLFINPLLGISADEVRALHASGQYSVELKVKASRIAVEETVSLISKSVLECVDSTHVSVFVYKPADIMLEAISQFFSLKGFWVEHEKLEDGNANVTLYW